jgi:hypothetical protein
MFIVENITGPMHIDVTGSVMWLRGTVLVDDKPVTTAPTIYLSSTDDYPWDTLVVFLLWLRCGWMVWRARTSTELGDGTRLEVVND